MQGELDYVPLADDLISQVADIHSQAFAGQMNVSLGQRYLFHFFKWFVEYPDSVTVVAKDGGHVRGYVIGAPLGYDKVLNRDLFWVTAGSICSHPSLWMKPTIQRAVIGRLIVLMGLQQQKMKYPELPQPIVSLVGIGVAPRNQNRHIGYQLMRIFEEKSKLLQIKSMKLSVYPDNWIARRLYEKCGWSASSSDAIPGQAMLYYKVISTL